ncbi:V-type ATPase subunit [Thioalkalicoccus limnaeus]|uniref:V-type ATPase subunit n=1 Tax=Thioalkalicoccus limnaeus TaxID=120681 RepID=A0ABV4BGZ6_9GAMM
MSDTSRQAYLHTRVSVMSTRLFNPGEFDALMRLDLAGMAERLGFRALLDEQLSTRGKSRAVEQTLIQTLLTELTILTRPMLAPERALVLAWGRRYALFNLKTLIRGKLHNLTAREIEDQLYELPPRLGLADQALLRTENVLELLRALEDGPHAPIARQAREVYEQRREPFALEAAIDQRYYAGLARHVMRLQDDHVEPLRDLVGALLDRVDLMWLLRFRFTYRLSPSETFFWLVPSFRLMHRERLLELVDLESIERVREALPTALADSLDGADTLIELQRHLGAHFARRARHILRRSRSGVARALAYLMLREMDLMTLFALIQGRLLGLQPDLVVAAVELSEPASNPAGRAAAA